MTYISILAITAAHVLTKTHCNTLQHTATHCNTLQHTATHCNTLQRMTYIPILAIIAARACISNKVAEVIPGGPLPACTCVGEGAGMEGVSVCVCVRV